jgi:hypothetical protein
MRRIHKVVAILALVSLIAMLGFAVFGETFGDATLTLQSRRYYSRWDLTRFVYRIKSPQNHIPDYWILGTGGCISEDQIDWYSSTAFSWADDPIVGLRFESYTKKDRFFLWLDGQWDVGSVDAAVIFDTEGGAASTYQGTIDGPLCEGSSISIDVTSGATVGFPQLLQAGTFPGDTSTQLLVSSTSSNWAIDYSPTFSIPENAQQSVVERILQVTVAPHGSGAGTTPLLVSYELNVTEQDFAGLPEGTYEIGITYTVTADD